MSTKAGEAVLVIHWKGGRHCEVRHCNEVKIAPTSAETRPQCSARLDAVRRGDRNSRSTNAYRSGLPDQNRSLSIAKFQQQTCMRKLDYRKHKYRGAGYIRLL